MRYFKHAPMAFWALFVLALGSLIAVAVYVGKDTTPSITSYNATYSQRDAAFEMMQRISGMYPAVTANNLQAWASETEAIASYNLDLYVENGGDAFDDVGQSWGTIVQYSNDLAAVDTNNSPLVLEKTALLGQAGQNLIVKVDSYTTPMKGVSR